MRLRVLFCTVLVLLFLYNRRVRKKLWVKYEDTNRVSDVVRLCICIINTSIGTNSFFNVKLCRVGCVFVCEFQSVVA